VRSGRLRTRIAVVFQDFVRYDLSARENIGFGDVRAIDDAAAIAQAAERAGAADFLTALPDGYETRLGRRFLSGHELSIGQWQKVALARAFFRDAPLVIMDEPTASLDARSEHELFKTMRGLFHDHAVLLISHRFSRRAGRRMQQRPPEGPSDQPRARFHRWRGLPRLGTARVWRPAR